MYRALVKRGKSLLFNLFLEYVQNTYLCAASHVLEKGLVSLKNLINISIVGFAVADLSTTSVLIYLNA